MWVRWPCLSPMQGRMLSACAAVQVSARLTGRLGDVVEGCKQAHMIDIKPIRIHTPLD